MPRLSIGLRVEGTGSLRDRMRQASRLGAGGIVVDATGEFHPGRLTGSGRREVNHLLRSVGLEMAAIHMPTRRSYDTLDDLDDRLKRADAAFELAHELGTSLVLARVGGIPADPTRNGTFVHVLGELARRADRRGVRLTIEVGPGPVGPVRETLDALGSPALAASLDPGAMLARGLDPVAAVRTLGPWLAHSYATDSSSTDRADRIDGPRDLAATPGSLDWPGFLGALEEVGYRGFLTAWPTPDQIERQLTLLLDRLKRF